jgi:hypothetical protein
MWLGWLLFHSTREEVPKSGEWVHTPNDPKLSDSSVWQGVIC